jgi:hypothetical protein
MPSECSFVRAHFLASDSLSRYRYEQAFVHNILVHLNRGERHSVRSHAWSRCRPFHYSTPHVPITEPPCVPLLVSSPLASLHLHLLLLLSDCCCCLESLLCCHASRSASLDHEYHQSNPIAEDHQGIWIPLPPPN